MAPLTKEQTRLVNEIMVMNKLIKKHLHHQTSGLLHEDLAAFVYYDLRSARRRKNYKVKIVQKDLLPTHRAGQAAKLRRYQYYVRKAAYWFNTWKHHGYRTFIPRYWMDVRSELHAKLLNGLNKWKALRGMSPVGDYSVDLTLDDSQIKEIQREILIKGIAMMPFMVCVKVQFLRLIN